MAQARNTRFVPEYLGIMFKTPDESAA